MRLTVKAHELRYAGRDMKCGEAFEATDKDGKLLVAIGKAEEAKPARRGESRPPAQTEGEGVKPRGRNYRRRDLLAEDSDGE